MNLNRRIQRLRESIVFQNRFARLYNDDVRWPSGTEGTYLRLGSGDGRPGVVAVPVHQAKLGLVHVYRYPLDSWQWGFPRGFAQSDDILETAARELAEEMGVRGRLSFLGWFSPDSGIQTGRVGAVLAEVEDADGVPSDTDEVSEVCWLSVVELLERLGRGEFDDGMTMSALALAVARGRVSL
ncbi:MAG: NUDIX hydrolase [Propionicimonas sp.]|uniref:NUDIX hydrolase n=1 Tax=Propionicimonas sp. TaxID=1955623 RepID=UPI003D10832C